MLVLYKIKEAVLLSVIVKARWGGFPCLILYVAFRVRRYFYFGIIYIIQTIKIQKQKKKWPNYQSIYYAHIYFILYPHVTVEMCDVPLWNLLKSKVSFKKTIVYKCMFWMCLILTNKNKENADMNERSGNFICITVDVHFYFRFSVSRYGTVNSVYSPGFG